MGEPGEGCLTRSALVSEDLYESAFKVVPVTAASDTPTTVDVPDRVAITTEPLELGTIDVILASRIWSISVDRPNDAKDKDIATTPPPLGIVTWTPVVPEERLPPLVLTPELYMALYLRDMANKRWTLSLCRGVDAVGGDLGRRAFRPFLDRRHAPPSLRAHTSDTCLQVVYDVSMSLTIVTVNY